MSARKRTTRRNKPKAVTQVVEVKVIRTKKQKLERGHLQPETGVGSRFLPRPLDAATIVDRQRLRELVTWRLQEREAWNQFQKLVSRGCNRDFLLDALANLAQTNTSGGGFKATFGRSKREVEAELGRMLRCADFVDGLPAHMLGELRNRVSGVPEALRAIESHLRMVAVKKRKRGRRNYDMALAAIVHQVKTATGGPRDSDVAQIVEAMREKDYSEEAHKDWFKKHQALVRNPWGS